MIKTNLSKFQNLLLIILGIIVILLSIVVLVKDSPNHSESELSILKDECLLEDGKWLDEFDECQGINQEICDELGGDFQECASACRHQNNDFCIEVCVKVCSF